MGKTLYLECESGISGDMTVASLLDLGADRKVLEDALADFGGTIITVSHARYFINRIANRIIEMQPNGVTDLISAFPG